MLTNISAIPTNADEPPIATRDALDNIVVDIAPSYRVLLNLLDDPETYLRTWAASLTTLADRLSTEGVDEGFALDGLKP